MNEVKIKVAILFCFQLFSICLQAQTNQKTLESFRLRARVSSLVEIAKTCPTNNGEGMPTLDCRIDTITYQFNKTGQLTSITKGENIQKHYYDKYNKIYLTEELHNETVKSTREFTYDREGNLTQKIYINGDHKEKVEVQTAIVNDTTHITEYRKNTNDQLSKLVETTYKNGLVNQITMFDSNGKPRLIWMYTYNSMGQEIKLERYEWWNGRKNCIIEIYQINNFGDSEKTEFYDCKSLTKNENIIYKYDRRENWIFKQVNGDDVNKIIKRTITYY